MKTTVNKLLRITSIMLLIVILFVPILVWFFNLTILKIFLTLVYLMLISGILWIASEKSEDKKLNSEIKAKRDSSFQKKLEKISKKKYNYPQDEKEHDADMKTWEELKDKQ